MFGLQIGFLFDGEFEVFFRVNQDLNCFCIWDMEKFGVDNFFECIKNCVVDLFVKECYVFFVIGECIFE